MQRKRDAYLEVHKTIPEKELEKNVGLATPLLVTHKPIFLYTPPRQFKKKEGKDDPLANALGRIPSHSVRAPRRMIPLTTEQHNRILHPAVVATSPTQNGNVTWSVAFYLEELFTLLLDINDLDFIMENALPPTREGKEELFRARDMLGRRLFALLQMPNPNTPPQ